MVFKSEKAKVTDELKGLAGNLLDAVTAIKAAEEAFGSVANIITKITTATSKTNELRIGYQQTFGIFEETRGRDLVKNVVDFTNTLNKTKGLELSAEKLAKNFEALGNQLDSFATRRSDATLMSFSKLVTLNEKFNISSDQSAKLINTLSNNFGLSTGAIESFNAKLIDFASTTGQSFNKVFQDFNQSIGQFFTILDKDRASTQFMAFQQMARGLGTSIESLMGVSKKFDSIQEATDFGAKLNNVLSVVGGSFDGVMASMMNYDERIKYITKQIGDSRSAIQGMSEVSQRAFLRQLQEASGLQDQVFQRVMNNQDLMIDLEKATSPEKGGFGALAEAPVEKMAASFTKLQDRANLFLNEYMRVGTRLEAIAVEQSKWSAKVQSTLLSPIADTVVNARKIEDIIKSVVELTKFLDKTVIEQKAKDAIAAIKAQGERSRDAITQSLKAPKKDVLATGIPGIQSAPSTSKPILEMRGSEISESISQGAYSGVKKAMEDLAKSATEKEYILHIEGNAELLAALGIKGKTINPTKVMTGGK